MKNVLQVVNVIEFMLRLRVSVLSILLLTSVDLVKAQESRTQQTNPPSLKWNQINTPNFRVLYPKGFEGQAQRMANTLEQIREPEAASIGVKPKRISIILQNQSSSSNGFVALAPRRSEFYAMPTQDYNFVGNNDWLNLLASHEYRHIVQYQRSITGFNKFFYYVLGQQALSGLASAAVPSWFWEGDAVATETAFTHSGRGRIPNFDLLLRTNFLEGRTFNYHKAYLRSYKHNIPDHYVLGYHMVSYLRKKTGDALIWERIAKRAWSLPFIPLTFSIATKKESGLFVRKLYAEMATELAARWRKELEGLPITAFEHVNPRKTGAKAYTDYKFPQVLEDGSIVVQKSGIGDIDQLVVIRNGVEVSKYTQGQVNESAMMSATRFSVVWNEFRYDPRWLMRTYSVIKRYDFKSKTATVISRNTRYASAALSPEGDRVATVETGTDYKTKLVILHGRTGQVLREFANPENDFISMPRWNSDGKSIVALKTNKTGKTIVRFDYEAGTSVELLPASEENIGYPVAFGKYVLYNSPYSGIDNIYALDTETGRRHQITCSKYGAYNPAVSLDGKIIYYNDQTRDGLDVVRIPFAPDAWRLLEEVRQPESTLYQHLVDQEGHPGLLDQVPTKIFAATRYHRASGMINPHSWGTYFTNSFTQAQFGIYSQDILSTTSVNAGYLFDINERVGFWQAGISYQGLYPIVDFNVSKGNRSVNEGDLTYKIKNGNTTVTDTRNLTFKWQETKIETGFRIPLLTTTSKFHSNITVGNYLGITSISDFHNSIDGGGRIVTTAFPQYIFRDVADNGTLRYNHFSTSAYRLLKKSRRDLYSKWGQAVSMESFSTPYGGDFSGNLFSVTGRFFFPGLFKHHSFNGYWAFQRSRIEVAQSSGKGLDNYLFSNQIPLPRGQIVPRFQEFYSMSGNYAFPLVYPDIALGPVVNFQRVSCNLFADYGFGQSNDFNRSQAYTSLGGEMKLDLNILRLLQQFNVGFRYSYLVEQQSAVLQFVIGNIPF